MLFLWLQFPLCPSVCRLWSSLPTTVFRNGAVVFTDKHTHTHTHTHTYTHTYVVGKAGDRVFCKNGTTQSVRQTTHTRTCRHKEPFVENKQAMKGENNQSITPSAQTCTCRSLNSRRVPDFFNADLSPKRYVLDPRRWGKTETVPNATPSSERLLH